MRMSRSSVLTAVAAAAVSVCVADARAATFEDEVRRYEAADRGTAPKAGDVLFLGGSNVCAWETLEADMPGLAVVRRGFARARLADFAPLIDRVAAPHKPSVIVLWYGAEDLGEGRRPEDVLAGFKAFARLTRKALPRTKLLCVSMTGRRARLDFEKANARPHALAPWPRARRAGPPEGHSEGPQPLGGRDIGVRATTSPARRRRA
ncbi:MAG: SGNH/GDSL hydrolase family protein [Planctomycetota bacterium]|jgi:hypothetical protein